MPKKKGCKETKDCDEDGTEDLADPDDKDPDIPTYTTDTDKDGVIRYRRRSGCADNPDCDGDGTGDKDDPKDDDPDCSGADSRH